MFTERVNLGATNRQQCNHIFSPSFAKQVASETSCRTMAHEAVTEASDHAVRSEILKESATTLSLFRSLLHRRSFAVTISV